MIVASIPWQSYTWKNDLDMQSKRVLSMFADAINDDFDGEYVPFHMLERALVLSAFCIRRLVEKRLVTDAFAGHLFSVRTFQASQMSELKRPFLGYSGGEFQGNYDFAKPVVVKLKCKSIADEFIHSSQLGIVKKSDRIGDGILINSDWHLEKRILHFTIEEFRQLVEQVLNDTVHVATDEWDPETGAVKASRR